MGSLTVRRKINDSVHFIGNRRGFTIVEVLIAIALLAGLTGITWVSMTNLYRSRDIIDEKAQRYQQVRSFFDRLSIELNAAFIAGPQLGGEELPGEVDAARTDSRDPNDIDAMARREPQQYGFIGDEHSIHFTTMGHRPTQLNERTGYASEIAYFMRPTDIDGRRAYKLMRREDVTIDGKLERGGVVFPVLNDIEDITFQYWDPGPVKLGTYEELAQGRWVREWDSTTSSFSGRLPSRVKVTLKLPPQGTSSNPEFFSTQIPIETTEVMEF